MWDADGKKYLDLISGFSVMNLGHGQAYIRQAIHKQVDEYMHLLVYGEIIESPQVQYAKKLTGFLPQRLDCVYFTNSGAEATEGAMKLAKRVTGRGKIVSFNNAYHGSTQGALSIMGGEYWRNAYRPLLPDVWHVEYNNREAIGAIDERTACVVMEVVQAEAGVCPAHYDWLHAIRKKCNETGALLVFDEIQTGFGRTGTLWAFEQYSVVPDILLLGKALGGGLPLGAFVSSYKNMQTLTNNPVLGHISTFAGHPVSCAAGLAGFELLTDGAFLQGLKETVDSRALLFQSLLKHASIRAIRGKGLLMAIEFANAEFCQAVCHVCIQKGAVTDWFLFAPHCLRIAPPLTITEGEVEWVCGVINEAIKEVINGGKK